MTHEYRDEITVPNLPDGWIAYYVELRGYDSPDCWIEAKHPDYPGRARVGVCVRDEDRAELLRMVEEIEAPSSITPKQWLNIGHKRGWP